MKAVDLGGIEYRMGFVSGKVISEALGDSGAWGFCESPFEGTEHPPRIMVDESLRGRKRMETTIHEMLHGALPCASEEWVEQIAREVERVLTEDGYRRREPPKKRKKAAPSGKRRGPRRGS